MVKAVAKLVFLTFGSLLLAILAVVAVRSIGFHQGFQAPSHVWFERSFWWIYETPVEDLCAGTPPPQDVPWIVKIPVRRKENIWFLPCREPLPLSDFLAKSPHPDFLLNVLAQDTWSLDELVAAVAPFDKSKHFAVMTESQKVAVYLRKKAPEWLFAADSASLLRFRLFESLWVETAMNFWPDFIIVPFAEKDSFQLDARGAAELQRRQKRIIWKWQDSTSEEPRVPIQGVMTGRPSAARQKFAERL